MTKGVQDRMVAVARTVDAFQRAVFADGDLGAAVALLAADAVLANVPVGTGAAGREAVARYLAEDVLPHRPADLAFTAVSRTGDRWRVVTEQTVSFTHDTQLPWLLPGVAPTGRRLEVLAVSIVAVPREVIAAHRTLWDLHSLHAQLR